MMASQILVQQPNPQMLHWNKAPWVAATLVGVANDLYLRGNESVAMQMYETAYQSIHNPCPIAFLTASQNLQIANSLLSNQLLVVTDEYESSDLYQEDECDVGPRQLKTPTRIDSSSAVDMDASFIEAVILLNKAILHHNQADHDTAKRMYQAVIATVQNILRIVSLSISHNLLEMGMRAHNNMGHICYTEADEEGALSHFEASIVFAKQLSGLNTCYRVEYASVLSNRCRVCWMSGDISDALYNDLREVLIIRSAVLSWNHPDLAASHFNIAMAEYARQRSKQATAHFTQYLRIAAYHAKDSDSVLDLIPALIYILLMRHEDRDDSMSMELVRGLRALQEKRQDQGPYSSEVASVLNFIGTLLFHQQDFENALIFFEEELRLEEAMDEMIDDLSVSVTCNNIGRILQERGKLHEAMHYYRRALEKEYGDISATYEGKRSTSMVQMTSPISKSLSVTNPSTANLYSTAWYNLGLIHDKLGDYGDAIVAFKMSLKLRMSMLGKDHPDIACLHYNIGVLQMEQQKLGDASASFREALRIRRMGTTGQLNDCHIVKTLEKLASLQKAKGNISGALDACLEVLGIQKVSSEYDDISRMREMGITHRSIAELHHARGDLIAALHNSIESVKLLDFVHSSDSHNTIHEKTANTEQLVSTLLLVGSLFQELCEPLEAHRVFLQATDILQKDFNKYGKAATSSLHSLREVTLMLTMAHCAPVA
jgi:tetratricopeptide (TPR) repeat protein